MSLSTTLRAALVALACAAASACGGGGGGSGTTITFDNSPASSASIVQVDFDFLDVSLLADRIESVDVAPGESASFDFDPNQTKNLFDVTITWSDATTTTIPLLPVAVLGEGDFSYPLTH
jgi:hypothetical protein